MISCTRSAQSRKLSGLQRSNVSEYSARPRPRGVRMSAMISWTRSRTSSWLVSANDFVRAVFR